MAATLVVRRRIADDLPMPVESATAAVQLASEPAFRIGPLQVTPSTRSVGLDGDEPTNVEPRVMQVLVALWRNAGDVVSRERLIAVCWDGRVVGDDAINSCVAKVRRIGESYGVFAVDTVPRVGYCLRSRGPTPAAARKSRLWKRVGIAAAVGLIALAVGWASAPSLRALWSPPVRAPRFSVLPIEPLSGDAQLKSFAAGLPPAIAAGLNDGQLLVASSAETAGVDFAIGGVVERDGDRLRARLKLDDVRGGVLLWSAEFSRAVADASGLQAEIAARLADVGSAAAVTRQPGAAPIDAAAVSAFIAGNDRYFPTDQRSIEDLAALFETVARQAPDFALGHAMFANMLLATTLSLPQESFAAVGARARTEAELALRLAPNEGRVYVPLAALTPAPAWREREEILTRGLSASAPAALLTLVYGRFLLTAGFVDEGVRVQRQALGERRAGPAPTWWLSWSRYLQGDIDGALQQLDDLLELQPRHFNARRARFEIAALERSPGEARQMLNDPDLGPLGVYPEGLEVIEAYLDARESGAPADRAAAVERILAFGAAHAPGDLGVLLLAALGELDAAFASADSYVDSPLTVRASYYFVPLFLYAPATRAMREDPRFIALLDKLDLPAYWRSTGRWPDFCAKEPRSVCEQLKNRG
jgi:DNA-binding winged helix-turn-helix (wHTH) protein/TolB-like protein